MKGARDFLILSFLGLILINLTLISAYILLESYGVFTLGPGERYTVNLPFLGPSKSPVICGKAQKNTGEALSGVNVSIYYDKNNSLIRRNTTNSQGMYCISLPEITANTKYNISIQYDNETSNGEPLQLGSNDYTFDFVNNQVYSRLYDEYVVLQGTIGNADAKIENGRFEINLKHQENGTWTEIFDYQKYAVNINSGESYEIPNNDLNVSWLIPDDASTGRYKFYIKTSFNAKERTANVYFNVTE